MAAQGRRTPHRDGEVRQVIVAVVVIENDKADPGNAVDVGWRAGS